MLDRIKDSNATIGRKQDASVSLKGFDFSDVGVNEDGILEEVTICQSIVVDVSDLEIEQLSVVSGMDEDDLWKLYERLYSPDGVMEHIHYMEEPVCKFFEEVVKRNKLTQNNIVGIKVLQLVDEIFQQDHKSERVYKDRLDKIDSLLHDMKYKLDNTNN